MTAKEQAEAMIQVHRALYYRHGTPVLSDFEYDKLEADLRKKFPDSEIINGFGEPPTKFVEEWKL